MIFIDESGVWEGMERAVARSFAGIRAFSHRGCYKGEKHTVIGAISVEGMVCIKTIKGSMKGKDFIAFLQENLCPVLDKEKVVIMDNLRIHKMKGVEELIAEKGAKVTYLPRYSPDFNPIEMLWSVMKTFLRMFKSKAIEKILDIFLLTVDKAFFRSWFDKCCYCTL